MKRLTVFLKTAVLSLFATLLAACASEVAPEPVPAGEPAAQTLTLRASLEGHPRTRTVIQEETQVFWEPGDAVKLFFGDADGRFFSTNTEPAGTASFTGTLNVLIGFNEGDFSEKAFWGLYPWREDATSDGLSVTTTLPAQQTAAAGTFARDTYITLGRSHNLAMGFRAVCGGVRFSLTQEDIREVRFESLGGEPLAGRIRIGFQDDVPAIQEITDASSAVTLTPPVGETFKPGEWYYIVALPGALERGYRLTFTKGSRTAEYAGRGVVTVKRAVFGSLKDVDSGLEFKIPGVGDPDEAIPFADERVKARLVAAFDGNGDGELSFDEADRVTSIEGVFGTDKDYTSFDEFRFFTGVTVIPELMFNSWGNLTSIQLPESLTTIGMHAFRNCQSLQRITIPDGVRIINRYAFAYCSHLTTCRLGDRVEEIGEWCFANCSDLKELTLSEALISIGGNAFRNCTSLEEVALPESLGSLGTNVFYGCSRMRSVRLPYTLHALPDGLFYHCGALQEAPVSDAVTAIGASAFRNCTGLSSVTLPAGLTAIGANAFSGCTSLQQIIVLSEAPPKGGSNMFNETNNCPIYVPSATAYLYSEAQYWKDYLARLKTEGGGVTYYTSTDYSRDGEVVTLQSASVGRGVNFVLLGDGYVDRDMASGGAYEQRMRTAMEALFAYEPYRSLRNRFNVYTVKVVSANAQYGDPLSNRRMTYDSGSQITFRSEVCLQYAGKAPKGGGGGQPVKVAVLCNSTSRVGRSYCIRYSSGQACCIVFDPNTNVLVHELCGHGFGDLWDEYSENSGTFTDYEGLDRDWTSRAWGANTDWRNDPATIRWAHLLADERYAGEGLGIFEGAKLYTRGIYRPTNNSMMRYNNCPFNAPSREQIYKNTMKWSEGSAWSYDYETFVAFDAAGREQAAGKLQAAPTLLQERDPERQHAESHIAPLLVDESVREVGFPVSGPAVPRLVRE